MSSSRVTSEHLSALEGLLNSAATGKDAQNTSAGGVTVRQLARALGVDCALAQRILEEEAAARRPQQRALYVSTSTSASASAAAATNSSTSPDTVTVRLTSRPPHSCSDGGGGDDDTDSGRDGRGRVYALLRDDSALPNGDPSLLVASSASAPSGSAPALLLSEADEQCVEETLARRREQRTAVMESASTAAPPPVGAGRDGGSSAAPAEATAGGGADSATAAESAAARPMSRASSAFSAFLERGSKQQQRHRAESDAAPARPGRSSRRVVEESDEEDGASAQGPSAAERAMYEQSTDGTEIGTDGNDGGGEEAAKGENVMEEQTRRRQRGETPAAEAEAAPERSFFKQLDAASAPKLPRVRATDGRALREELVQREFFDAKGRIVNKSVTVYVDEHGNEVDEKDMVRESAGTDAQTRSAETAATDEQQQEEEAEALPPVKRKPDVTPSTAKKTKQANLMAFFGKRHS